MSFLAAALLAAGCSDPPGSATRPCAGKIGLIAGLSGAAAQLGADARKAAQLAVDQFVTRNPDCSIELLAKDPGLDTELAKRRAAELATDPRVLGVIGPFSPPLARGTNAVFSTARLTFMQLGGNAPDFGEQGQATFHRAIATEPAMIAATGRYLTDVLRTSKLFAVINSSLYAPAHLAGISAAIRPVGASTISGNRTDFSAEVARIVSSGADVVYCACALTDGALLRQLRAAGSSATFVGGQGLRGGEFLQGAGAAAEGAVIISYNVPLDQIPGTFVADYRAKFGTEPGVSAAESFATATLYLDAVKAGNTTRSTVEAYVDGYDGETIAGHWRFTQRGELDPAVVTLWALKVRAGALATDQKLAAAD